MKVWCAQAHNEVIGTFLVYQGTITRTRYPHILEVAAVPKIKVVRPLVILRLVDKTSL
jgi:hypothetical protein